MKKTDIAKVLLIVQIILSLVFLIGIRTFFAPCGPKEDGSWMHCHMAGEALTGIAAVILLLSLLSLVLHHKTWQNLLEILKVLLAALGLLIPGTLVSLCMMPEMRCRASMQPWSMLLCVLLLLLAAVRRYVLYRQGKETP